jgi:hypothetical protein
LELLVELQLLTRVKQGESPDVVTRKTAYESQPQKIWRGEFQLLREKVFLGLHSLLSWHHWGMTVEKIWQLQGDAKRKQVLNASFLLGNNVSKRITPQRGYL